MQVKTSGRVFVKSIPRQTATKISELTSDTTGKRINATKQGRATETIRAVYSSRMGALNTGLDKLVDNPWKDKPEKLTQEFKYVAEKDEISLQEYFEIEYERPKGYYTNRAPRKGELVSLKNNGYDVPFFWTFGYPLRDGTNALDLSKHDDRIAYYLFLANNKVASSEKEWRSHKWPLAKFYIALENESEDIKYKRAIMEDKAIAKLNSEDMTPLVQKQVIKAIGLKRTSPLYEHKGELTDQKAYNVLREYIKGGKQSEIETFNKTVDLLDTADGREELDAMSLLKDLISYNIVGDRKEIYTWFRKKIELGNRTSEAIRFLMNPNKQLERDELEEELKAKRGY